MHSYIFIGHKSRREPLLRITTAENMKCCISFVRKHTVKLSDRWQCTFARVNQRKREIRQTDRQTRAIKSGLSLRCLAHSSNLFSLKLLRIVICARRMALAECTGGYRAVGYSYEPRHNVNVAIYILNGILRNLFQTTRKKKKKINK